MSRAHLDIPLTFVTRSCAPSTTTLRDLVGGQPLLVVLARHAACPYCPEYIDELASRASDVGRVVVVAEASVNATERSLSTQPPPEFLITSDPELRLHRALGAHRATSVRDMRIGLRAVPTLVRRARRSVATLDMSLDLRVMGSDIVLDSNGDVHWLRHATRMDDRPDVDTIIRAMRRAGVTSTRHRRAAA